MPALHASRRETVNGTSTSCVVICTIAANHVGPSLWTFLSFVRLGTHSSLYHSMLQPPVPPLNVPPAAGGPAPPAVIVPASVTPHNFQRVTIMGTDAAFDYWACPATSKLVRALPGLGWVDASSILPGCKAAPGSLITAVAIPGVSFDKTAPGFAAIASLSELVASFDVGEVSRITDVLASFGLFDKTYTNTATYFEAYEALMPKLPSPSPLRLSNAGCVVVLQPFDRAAIAGVEKNVSLGAQTTERSGNHRNGPT